MGTVYSYVPVYTNDSGVRIKLGEFDYLSAAKDKILTFCRSNPISRKHTFSVLMFRDGLHFKTNYYFYAHSADLIFNACPEVQP